MVAIANTREPLKVSDSIVTNASFDNVNLSNSHFANVNLSVSRFTEVNLTNAAIENANVSNVTFRNVNMSNVDIADAQTAGMRINGILLSDLLAAYGKQLATDLATDKGSSD